MKVFRINKWFGKFATFLVKQRWMFLITAILLTVFSFLGLNKLQPSNARDSWFEDSEEIEINTQKFEEQFGNNDNIAILIEANDVFDPEVLKMMQELGEELLDSIPYADEINSLVEMEISVGTDYGIEVINPFEHGISEDPAELEEIRQLVLSRKSIVNKIVSEDCTETWMTLSLLEFPETEEWKKETTKDPLFQVGEVAIRIITDPKWESDKYTLKPAGMPYSETEERDFFAKETAIRILSVFIAMILLLIVFVRSLRGVLVPILTILLSMVVVFGTMGWAGISYESSMLTLPILLGMALSVAYSLHLINFFKRFYRNTGSRKQSVISAIEETGWPLFFTAVTTIGSVMSFATVGIITISWVGYTCGALVLVNFLFTIILLPITLSFGKDKKVNETQAEKNTRLENAFENLGKIILNNKLAFIISFIAISIALLPGVTKVKVNMDNFKAMGTKIPYVNRLYEITQSQLGSYLNYNISIDYKEQDAIKDPAILKNVDVLVDTVKNFYLTKQVSDDAAVFSVVDIIKEMNQTLNSDSIKYHSIPDTREGIAQLLLLYEMSGGTKTFNWIDENYSMLRMQVQVREFNAKEIERELSVIKNMSNELFEGATVTVVGSAVQFAEINNKVVTGEIKSVLISLFIITILLILVFGSIKTGLIGLIPNLAPVIAIGAYLGYTNTPLEMMTMTIIPMLLGIAVDDTIHFINSIKYEFEKSGNYRLAILTAFKTVGKTLAMTTIVLGIGFGMFIFSPVGMLHRIGLLASSGLVIALVTDYLITPITIILTKPFGKERIDSSEDGSIIETQLD